MYGSLPYAINGDNVEFRVFLTDLERSLKVWRAMPALQRLHALPSKNHNRTAGKISNNLCSGSRRDVYPAVVLDRFLSERNVLSSVAALITDLIDRDHVDRRLGLRMESLKNSSGSC